MSDMTLVYGWTDTNGREPDESGDYGWPYPDEHKRFVVSGNLRDDIIARSVADSMLALTEIEGVHVEIEEVCTSGGYSEYTQENDYEITVNLFAASSPIPIVPFHTDFDSSAAESGFGSFMRWVEGR